MEDKTLQSLEIKRARLRGIRPLTKEEIKVKAEIDMIKYFNGIINKQIKYQEEVINSSKGMDSVIEIAECSILVLKETKNEKIGKE